MSIDNPGVWNLTIRKGRDYSKTFNINIDVSAYSGRAQIRSGRAMDSEVLATFDVTVGSYGSGVTPVTLELTDVQTAAVGGHKKGYWDVVLTSSGTPPLSSETYIEGRVDFVDVPTELASPTATNMSTAESFTEGAGSVALTNIVVTDADSEDVTATLTISDSAAGVLTTTSSGTTTSTFAAGVWTAAGPIADVNALLAAVAFTPATNYDQNFTITTEIDDGVNPAIAGEKAVTVTAVNDASTATGLDTAEAFTENGDAFILSPIEITDVDTGETVTATLTMSDAAAGTMSTGTSSAVTSTFVAGVWTAAGLVADVNALLADITFTPATDYDQSFTIDTSVDDGVAAAVTGTKAVTVTPEA